MQNACALELNLRVTLVEMTRAGVVRNCFRSSRSIVKKRNNLFPLSGASSLPTLRFRLRLIVPQKPSGWRQVWPRLLRHKVPLIFPRIDNRSEARANLSGESQRCIIEIAVMVIFVTFSKA